MEGTAEQSPCLLGIALKWGCCVPLQKWVRGTHLTAEEYRTSRLAHQSAWAAQSSGAAAFRQRQRRCAAASRQGAHKHFTDTSRCHRLYACMSATAECLPRLGLMPTCRRTGTVRTVCRADMPKCMREGAQLSRACRVIGVAAAHVFR